MSKSIVAKSSRASYVQQRAELSGIAQELASKWVATVNTIATLNANQDAIKRQQARVLDEIKALDEAEAARVGLVHLAITEAEGLQADSARTMKENHVH